MKNNNWLDTYKTKTSITRKQEPQSSPSQIFDKPSFRNAQYFTIEEVAEKLKVSPKFIYEQLYAKRLIGKKAGRIWRIEETEIEKWLTLQQKGG